MRCLRSQGFGHHRRTCLRPFICAVCAGRHQTEECIKKKKEQDIKAEFRCPNCRNQHPAWSMSCPARKKQIREKIEQQQQRLQHQLQPQGDMSGPRPRLDSMAEFPPPEPRQLARTSDTTQTTTPTTAEAATQTVHTPNIYHTKDTATICITLDTLKTLLK